MKSCFLPTALLLMSSAVMASAAPAVAPMPVAPAAPSPTVDPQAEALLTAMVTADNALTSYSGVVQIKDQSTTSQVIVNVDAPLYASAVASSQGKPLGEAITNGKTVDVVDYALNKYVEQTISAGIPPVVAVLQQSHSVLLALLADPGQVAQVLQSAQTKSIAMGADGMVGSTATKTVVASIEVKPQVVETVTFGISAADDLLRSVAFNVTLPSDNGEQPQAMSHVESLTTFVTDPDLTPKDFQFVPPAGLENAPWAEHARPAANPKLQVGTAPFPIHATDLSGRPVSLSAYRGKVVLLDFWATWSSPDRDEIPALASAYMKYHAEGLDIIGISLDHANQKAALKTFMVKNHMPWPEIYDGDYLQGKIAVEYGVQGVPFNLIIGKNGEIAAVDVTAADLDPAIKAALAEK